MLKKEKFLQIKDVGKIANTMDMNGKYKVFYLLYIKVFVIINVMKELNSDYSLDRCK